MAKGLTVTKKTKIEDLDKAAQIYKDLKIKFRDNKERVNLYDKKIALIEETKKRIRQIADKAESIYPGVKAGLTSEEKVWSIQRIEEEANKNGGNNVSFEFKDINLKADSAGRNLASVFKPLGTFLFKNKEGKLDTMRAAKVALGVSLGGFLFQSKIAEASIATHIFKGISFVLGKVWGVSPVGLIAGLAAGALFVGSKLLKAFGPQILERRKQKSAEQAKEDNAAEKLEALGEEPKDSKKDSKEHESYINLMKEQINQRVNDYVDAFEIASDTPADPVAQKNAKENLLKIIASVMSNDNLSNEEKQQLVDDAKFKSGLFGDLTKKKADAIIQRKEAKGDEKKAIEEFDKCYKAVIDEIVKGGPDVDKNIENLRKLIDGCTIEIGGTEIILPKETLALGSELLSQIEAAQKIAENRGITKGEDKNKLVKQVLEATEQSKDL